MGRRRRRRRRWGRGGTYNASRRGVVRSPDGQAAVGLNACVPPPVKQQAAVREQPNAARRRVDEDRDFEIG